MSRLLVMSSEGWGVRKEQPMGEHCLSVCLCMGGGVECDLVEIISKGATGM